MLSKCGGKIGGPEVVVECPPLDDLNSSKFGLFWPQPFSGYLLSLLEKKMYIHMKIFKKPCRLENMAKFLTHLKNTLT